jgi:NADPH:quinone reductase
VRAIEVSRFGGPEVLTFTDLPDPVPKAGQILVASSASDVLFVDTMVRSGLGVDYFPIRPPYVPGNGMGGYVVGVGDGVQPSWLGRQVVAHTGGPGGSGGYAELAAVDIDACAVVRDGLDLLEATAVLHDGTTALRVIETTGIEPGEWALVLGAAGGMGILLVQLLVARGAHVVGAAGGRTKREVVSQAGARAAVDYGQSDWADAALDATDGRRPSLVLDGVGGRIGGEAFGLIAEGGRFSAHGAPSGSFAPIDPETARSRGVAVTTIADLQYAAGDRARLLAAALDEITDRRIKPLIGQTFSIVDASKAHMAIEARETVAKTLLLNDQE